MEAAFVSVRVVNVDWYLSDESKLPVIRVFGSTPAGQKACVHLHGALPYFLIRPIDGQDRDAVAAQFESPVALAEMLPELEGAIEAAMAVARSGLAPGGGQGYSRGKPSSHYRVIAGLAVVQGVPFYGFCPGRKLFVKVTVNNPALVGKVASVLQAGHVMSTAFQPFESHVPFLLQVFVDYNISGMSYVHLSNAIFLRPLPKRASSHRPLSRPGHPPLPTQTCDPPPPCRAGPPPLPQNLPPRPLPHGPRSEGCQGVALGEGCACAGRTPEISSEKGLEHGPGNNVEVGPGKLFLESTVLSSSVAGEVKEEGGMDRGGGIVAPWVARTPPSHTGSSLARQDTDKKGSTNRVRGGGRHGTGVGQGIDVGGDGGDTHEELLAGISIAELFSQPTSSPSPQSRPLPLPLLLDNEGPTLAPMHRPLKDPNLGNWSTSCPRQPSGPASYPRTTMSHAGADSGDSPARHSGQSRPRSWWERQTNCELELVATFRDLLNPGLLNKSRGQGGQRQGYPGGKPLTVASLGELWEEERARQVASGGRGSQLSAPPGLALASSQEPWVPPSSLLPPEVEDRCQEVVRSIVGREREREMEMARKRKEEEGADRRRHQQAAGRHELGDQGDGEGAKAGFQATPTEMRGVTATNSLRLQLGWKGQRSPSRLPRANRAGALPQGKDNDGEDGDLMAALDGLREGDPEQEQGGLWSQASVAGLGGGEEGGTLQASQGSLVGAEDYARRVSESFSQGVVMTQECALAIAATQEQHEREEEEAAERDLSRQPERMYSDDEGDNDDPDPDLRSGNEDRDTGEAREAGGHNSRRGDQHHTALDRPRRGGDDHGQAGEGGSRVGSLGGSGGRVQVLGGPAAGRGNPDPADPDYYQGD
ncbi:unnamed protein product, partial [Discosporangium mesarthrocarpum]